MAENSKELVRAIIGEVFVRVRLLELVAAFGFLVLAIIGWSYHGHHRPRELDVTVAVLVSFCFVAEFLFWVLRKTKRPAGDK